MAIATRDLAGATLPAPGAWTVDPSHSEVGFSVRHLGLSKVRGRFGTVEGTVLVAEQPDDTTVTVSIDAASIDTGDATRDEHLRSADFLDVDTHPTLEFRSTSVTGAGSRWQLAGDLTIRGITRPVVLDVTFEGIGPSPWGDTRAAFTATTEINRDDFGLTWNQALETGGVLVGKRVTIELDVQLAAA